MILKPQDILISLKLLSSGGRKGSFANLGKSLHMSASETHAALQRARKAGLIHPLEDRAIKSSVLEFLQHGIKYVFPAVKGPRTRGIPTGYAAPPINTYFNVFQDDPGLPVWPDPEGKIPGTQIQPICRSAPAAAKEDPLLYEWLVLADVMRGVGRARERERAKTIITERLGPHAPH